MEMVFPTGKSEDFYLRLQVQKVLWTVDWKRKEEEGCFICLWLGISVTPAAQQLSWALAVLLGS